MSIKILSPLICGREECKLFLLKLSGVKMRVIMPDSVLSSPTDDHNEKPTYECPLPSCLSTGTLSKLPCHLLQIVSDCAKNRAWIRCQRQPRRGTVMVWQKNLFRLRFRIIPHRFPWWPWEELHLSAERSQWQHRSIDLSFVLSEQPSVDILEECREVFHPQQPGWGRQLSEAVLPVTPQSHSGFYTQSHVTYIIIWSCTLKNWVKCNPVWVTVGYPMLGKYIGLISAHTGMWITQHARLLKLAKD